MLLYSSALMHFLAAGYHDLIKLSATNNFLFCDNIAVSLELVPFNLENMI